MVVNNIKHAYQTFITMATELTSIQRLMKHFVALPLHNRKMNLFLTHYIFEKNNWVQNALFNIFSRQVNLEFLKKFGEQRGTFSHCALTDWMMMGATTTPVDAQFNFVFVTRRRRPARGRRFLFSKQSIQN